MENNKEKTKAYNKEYNKKTKEKKSKYNKQYNDDHFDYFREAIECKICHKMIMRTCMSRHHKTKKCMLSANKKNSDGWNNSMFIME